MQNHHWFMLLVVLIAGYTTGRYFPSLGQKIGLP